MYYKFYIERTYPSPTVPPGRRYRSKATKPTRVVARPALSIACAAGGIATAAGGAVTLFQTANPDEQIFLTTRSDRVHVNVIVGIALTVVGLGLVASVVRQPGARHANRLVAGAVVLGGAGVTTSMGGLLWLSWLCVAAGTFTLVLAAIRVDRRRQMSRRHAVSQSAD